MKFIKERGRPLVEINPGSDEMALKIDDALKAIELLQNTHLAILGGDILSDESGELTYIYENWYCEKIKNENQDEYRNRSFDFAKKYINNLVERGSKNLFVVLVT